MKKSILSIILGLAALPTALADDAANEITTAGIEPTDTKTCPFNFSVKGSVVHTSVGYWDDEDMTQNVPSLLYGITLGGSWDYLEAWGFTHAIGVSLGAYSGNYKSIWDEGNWWDTKTGEYTSQILYRDTLKTNVLAVPLTISYDLKKDFSDSLCVYVGVRTGAMLRRTTANGFFGGGLAPMAAVEYKDVHSTRIMPMVGMGAGIQMFLSDKWSLSLSYDFVWTLGKDSGRLRANSGKADYDRWAPNQTSERYRYYGTISFGVTYTF